MYSQFVKYGRNTKEIFGYNKEIYTEMELEYYMSVLKRTGKKKYREEMTQEEFERIVSEHYSKGVETLRILMNSVSLGYYFEKLKF